MTKLTIQQQILSWLGMYRDNLPIEAVHKLQDLLELQPQEEKTSILPQGKYDKLRVELERISRENIGIVHAPEKARYNLAQYVLSLLNELEKEQPPAPEELKLEKLFDFIAIPSTPTDSFEFSYTQDIGKQVQHLTTTVNLLIDKLNNK